MGAPRGPITGSSVNQTRPAFTRIRAENRPPAGEPSPPKSADSVSPGAAPGLPRGPLGPRVRLPCPHGVSGVVVSGVVVDVWDDAAADWTTPSPGHRMRPAGRVMVHAAGWYRVRCSLLPAAPPPDPIGEAIGRCFAMREQMRPGDKTLDGTAVNLSASIIRSGAGEVLLPWRSLTM